MKKKMVASAGGTLWLGLLFVGLFGTAEALTCGETFTKDCIEDHRYKEGGNVLGLQSAVWRRSGLFRVNVYSYNGAYYQSNEVSDIADFPYLGFVNITVSNTRYYYHGIFMEQPNGAAAPGHAFYVERYGHSSFEKDGSAVLLDERRQGTNSHPQGVILHKSSSDILPIGSSKTVRHTELRAPALDGSQLTYETLTCQEQTSCDKMTFVEKNFNEDGSLHSFTSGTYTRMENSTEWLSAISDAYSSKQVPVDQQRDVLKDPCLITAYCVSEKEWCTSGDPSCAASPYQQEDGELRAGVIAAIVIGSFFFAVITIIVGRIVILTMLERRYRTDFVSRFAEDVPLQKALKDVTSETMTREFGFIDKQGKGYITKGELTDFMNTSKVAKKIKGRHFNKLWKKMDLNKNGTVDYVEFCAFTADCYREHSILREQARVMDENAKKTAG